MDITAIVEVIYSKQNIIQDYYIRIQRSRQTPKIKIKQNKQGQPNSYLQYLSDQQHYRKASTSTNVSEINEEPTASTSTYSSQHRIHSEDGANGQSSREQSPIVDTQRLNNAVVDLRNLSK